MMKAGVKQIFVFLMVIILIGLVFLFGLKSISGLKKDACSADLALSIKQLNEMVDRYNTFGSVHTEKLNPPCGYTEICFVDADIDRSRLNIDSINNNMLKSVLRDDLNHNVFFVKQNEVKPVSLLSKIKVDSGFVCKQLSGNSIVVKFVGTGRKTRVE